MDDEIIKDEVIEKIKFLRKIILQKGACEGSKSCPFCKRTLFRSIPNAEHEHCSELCRLSGIGYTQKVTEESSEVANLAKKELVNILRSIKWM
jgi:hypothetical protein